MNQSEEAGPGRREHRIIAAGFGGQGILTLGRLLCIAAMREGKMVTYMPSYGAEVRGGTANCQVVISPGTIYSPLVEQADSLIIMNQPSYERFRDALKPGGLVALNSSAVEPDGATSDIELLPLPAAETAADMGNARVGNVIMLGAFAEVTGLIRQESAREALREVFTGRKAEMLDLNLEALEAGARMATG